LNKETTIPDKLYFKIGEVCDITGVKQHVLRYWESEFKILSPQRAHSRQRLYRREDVENILRIKRLLKEEGFTISGAKKLLAAERRRPRPAPEPPSPAKPAAATPPATGDQAKAATIFSGIKEELLTLKKILEQR
jgi:DNA-binding transcriptional MerR regulator